MITAAENAGLLLVAGVDGDLVGQVVCLFDRRVDLRVADEGGGEDLRHVVAELLELPSGAGPVFGVCIGYAQPEAAGEVKPRLPQEVVLHHDRYSTAAEDEGRAAYDKRLEVFSRRHEMAAYTWTERVINRMAKLNALTGRHLMKDAFRALGFPMR